jgi:trk system potassium uptake protein TrkH
MEDCLFETASALGTVGLSLGITTSLGTASRCILMLLMFMGRVGGLTFVYAFLSSSNRTNSKLPIESIMVG